MAAEKIEIATLSRIHRLCELEARPPTIMALLTTAAVKEQFVRAQWTSILGKNPPRGPLPLKVDIYFSSYQARLQSSYFIAIWRKLKAANLHRVDVYIGAYEQYTRTFGLAKLMSFDRAWALARAYASDMVTSVECDCCGSHYIHNPHDLINHKNCPSCRVFNLREKRRQKTAAPAHRGGTYVENPRAVTSPEQQRLIA